MVGKDGNDAYSKKIKEAIKEKDLEEIVFIYGLKNDIHHIITQSTICILTSFSEGLPVALLEYGLSKNPLVSTNVGEIPRIITNRQNG